MKAQSRQNFRVPAGKNSAMNRNSRLCKTRQDNLALRLIPSGMVV